MLGLHIHRSWPPLSVNSLDECMWLGWMAVSPSIQGSSSTVMYHIPGSRGGGVTTRPQPCTCQLICSVPAMADQLTRPCRIPYCIPLLPEGSSYSNRQPALMAHTVIQTKVNTCLELGGPLSRSVNPIGGLWDQRICSFDTAYSTPLHSL